MYKFSSPSFPFQTEPLLVVQKYVGKPDNPPRSTLLSRLTMRSFLSLSKKRSKKIKIKRAKEWSPIQKPTDPFPA
jgi:hypothetical protein